MSLLKSIRDGIASMLLGGQDARGDTILHAAFRNKSNQDNQAQLIRALKVLLARTGVAINAKNKEGKTILHLAVEHRMADVVDFYLEQNVDPNESDGDGNTIAHFIIEEECRKLHSFINKHRFAELERIEDESTSFFDRMLSTSIDFLYNRNKKNFSGLYLANELNLQHILLKMLKRIRDLPAAEKGQRPLICAFLDRNGNKYYETLEPIHCGSYSSRHECDIVRILLDKGQPIDDKTLATIIKPTLVSYHCNRLDLKVVELLLQKISIVHFDEFYESLISVFTRGFNTWNYKCYAEVKDDMEILRTLILKGADVNERDKNRETIAHKLFCRFPKLQMLELLKESGADFNARLHSGQNFLHSVCEYGNEVGMIDLIMDGSGDVNATDSRDRTPLEIAVRFMHDSIVNDLIKHGAKVNVDHKNAISPLFLACATGQAQVAQILIESGADLDYRDKFHRSLLHVGVDYLEVVKLLIQNGAYCNTRDHMGKTALHQVTNATVVKILFDAGALVDMQDEQGIVPLYDALFQNELDVIKELLKCGASLPDLTDYFNSLLETSVNNDKDSIYQKFRYLLEHLVKLMAADLPNLKNFFKPGEIDEDLQKFFKQCCKEVQLLKTIFIDDCTSLYNLIHKAVNRRCSYIHNEELGRIVENIAINKKFLNYAVVIEGCYNEAKTRMYLLGLIMEHTCIGELPELCADKITEYLSNVDLINILRAYELEKI